MKKAKMNSSIIKTNKKPWKIILGVAVEEVASEVVFKTRNDISRSTIMRSPLQINSLIYLVMTIIMQIRNQKT